LSAGQPSLDEGVFVFDTITGQYWSREHGWADLAHADARWPHEVRDLAEGFVTVKPGDVLLQTSA